MARLARSAATTSSPTRFRTEGRLAVTTTSKIRTILFAGAMMLCSAAALADEANPYADRLTGNWGGYRTWLLDHGIDTQIDHVSETASNVQGGANQSTRYTDQWTFG